ncbi:MULTISPECIES: DUF2092 domain-containing protein [Rhizobium]|nr:MULTISPECIES: DUF2092 domain-containing protein [Rhizobium]MCS0462395.1 DUF2092 domain-containing protein [Rhizobium favelukesii]UFS85216.1 DUF2092 domain-containing protein [Rhizobium sp. T136]
MQKVMWSTAAARLSALALICVLGAPPDAGAGEAEAKGLLKAMSDYLDAQETISFGYDSNLEVVTKDHQKILLASSGKIKIERPDKIRVARTGGFADVEMIFDGKTLSVLGKNLNLYTQVEVPGTVEHLVDELREKLHKPIPGADLLLPKVYDELIADVVDVKDLGSGVIGGTECDHLAFRAKEVDWQIWIAQGEHPYPCRYVITANKVDQAPQYSIQIRDWKTGTGVTADDFVFDNAIGAKKADLAELKDIDELPAHFSVGGGQ